MANRKLTNLWRVRAKIYESMGYIENIYADIYIKRLIISTPDLLYIVFDPCFESCILSIPFIYHLTLPKGYDIDKF